MSRAADVMNMPDKWREIHANTLIVDGLDCSVPTPHYAEMLDEVGVNCMHLTIEDMDGRGGLYPFERIFRLLDEPDCRFRLARSAVEIERAATDGKIALVFGRQASDPLNVAHDNLRCYYELGLRVSGIAYNLSNRFGGGCLTPNVPLSEDGIALVKEANRLGILLDVGGHTGERTSLEVIERADGRPVVCTHCGAAGRRVWDPK
jgi:membrane dipeptidase